MDDIGYCGPPESSWFYSPPQYLLAPDNASSDWSYPTDAHIGAGIEFLNLLKHFAETYQPVHGYLCVCLCTFGLLTNVFNFVVLTRPNMRTSINMILAAIALCDTGTMTTYLIYVLRFYVSNAGSQCTTYTYAWMNFILFHSLWSILLHSSSIWLVVLLALMRVAVMRRMKFSQVFLKPENVWKFMLYIYAPLGLLCIPVIFTHSVKELPEELVPACPLSPVESGRANASDPNAERGSGVYTVIPSMAALQNDCLLLRVVLWINGLCFKLLPCLLLAFSIWGLLRTLREAKERNDRVLRRRSDAQKCKYFSSRTTKMLLAILLIFLVTELPQALVATLSGLNPHDIYFKIYPVVGDLLDLLSLLNSGVNFLLYCGMSSRFRSTFVELFAPKCLRLSWRRRRRGFSVSDNEGAYCNGVTLTAAHGVAVQPIECESLRRASGPATYTPLMTQNSSTIESTPISSFLEPSQRNSKQYSNENDAKRMTHSDNRIKRRRFTMMTLLSCDSPATSLAPRVTTNSLSIDYSTLRS